MNFKKTLLITSIMATAFSGMANAASADANGTIHFKGQFIDSTCMVEVNNANKNEGTIQLGTWMSNSFDKVGEKTDAIPFLIGLSGCPATLNQAIVTFSGTANSDNPELYNVDKATGVGIGLSSDNVGSTYYQPNSPAGSIDLSKGNKGEKEYFARYVTTADAVTPGTANADVTVTIKYTQ
ncbi:MAG TPA: pilus assembly protein [Providencia sp.]|uniref:fimbrial protein n=2 Tax=Providencia TaxID=586 RepID=UPI000E9923E4|nr:fimbrial protein [Providencia sp.]MBP6082081.1 fimbrial protein [Providencia sp.]HBO22560.1 pilus assembly protein [Providencia sp.]